MPLKPQTADRGGNSPRWLRFSLRALLVAITLFCVWLGYEINIVRTRQALRKEAIAKGFLFTTADEYRSSPSEALFLRSIFGQGLGEPKSISFVRRWLGDEAIQAIEYPGSNTLAEEAAVYARYFPEAKVAQASVLFSNDRR